MPASDSLLNAIKDLHARSAALEMPSADFRRGCEEALQALGPFIDQARSAPGFPENVRRRAQESSPTPIQRMVQEQLTGGIETASGNFMGFIPGGGLLSAAIADLICATTNRFAGFSFAAPGAVAAENEVIRWLCELFGLGAEAWGSLTSGGTAATLNCLFAARETVKEVAPERLAIYATEQSHHAIRRTLKMLGLHRSQIHTVAMDRELRMDTAALALAVAKDRQAGLKPFLVVATAGTTNTGAVDPMKRISELCRQEGLWMHVDAAYGGFFILCPETQHLLDGIELADSLVVDPHKGMFLPYGVGAGLVRDHRTLKAAMLEDAPYLPNVEQANRSPAEYSFELTRHNRAPRIQLSLRLFGVSAFSAALSEKLLLARWLNKRLTEIPGIELFTPEPALSVVAFSMSDNAKTQELLDFILADGALYVSPTQIDGRLWIRACILSFRTHLENVEALLRRVMDFSPKDRRTTE